MPRQRPPARAPSLDYRTEERNDWIRIDDAPKYAALEYEVSLSRAEIEAIARKRGFVRLEGGRLEVQIGPLQDAIDSIFFTPVPKGYILFFRAVEKYKVDKEDLEKWVQEGAIKQFIKDLGMEEVRLVEEANIKRERARRYRNRYRIKSKRPKWYFARKRALWKAGKRNGKCVDSDWFNAP